MYVQEMLVYRPLDMRINGGFIDHLDFSKARDVAMLVQMLENAIYCAKVHCRKNLLGQARAFSGSISQGFESAKKNL